MAARLRVAPLDKQLEWDVILLKRQYLQMLDPEKLRIPTFEALRSPVVQAKIYNTVFNDNQLAFAPPVRYKFRVLKRIIDAIEQSIFDPEEDVGFSLSGVFPFCLIASGFSLSRILYHLALR